MSCGDICLAFLAVFFPPIAVWIKRGLCSADSLLNLLLLILGYIPGLLHAWYIIAKYPDSFDEYERVPTADPESGNARNGVTYYYVSHGPGLQAPGPAAAGQPDGGRAHREIQRMGSYGAIRGAEGQGGNTGGNAGQQQQGASTEGSGSAGGSGVGAGGAKAPPSYAEAVQGDHKVQT